MISNFNVHWAMTWILRGKKQLAVVSKTGNVLNHIGGVMVSVLTPTRSTHSAVLSSLKQQSTCRFTQDTLSRFWANVSLLLLLNATCLEEKQQIPIIVFGVSTLTITPPMWFKTLPVLDTTASCFFPLNIHVIAQCTLMCLEWIDMWTVVSVSSTLHCVLI
jgi:hypothetical protein